MVTIILHEIDEILHLRHMTCNLFILSHLQQFILPSQSLQFDDIDFLTSLIVLDKNIPCLIHQFSMRDLLEIRLIYRLLNSLRGLIIFLLCLLMCDALSISFILRKLRDTISNHFLGFMKSVQGSHLFPSLGQILVVNNWKRIQNNICAIHICRKRD